MNTDSTRLSPPDRWSGIEQPHGGVELPEIKPKPSGDLAGTRVAEVTSDSRLKGNPENFKQAANTSPRTVTLPDVELFSTSSSALLLAERIADHEATAVIASMLMQKITKIIRIQRQLNVLKMLQVVTFRLNSN